MTATPAARSAAVLAAAPAAKVFAPGTRVRVTTQAPRQEGTFTSVIEGVVVGQAQKPTGSWFAHGKNDKLWLERLTVRKDDGELVVCNLDGLASVEAI